MFFIIRLRRLQMRVQLTFENYETLHIYHKCILQKILVPIYYIISLAWLRLCSSKCLPSNWPRGKWANVVFSLKFVFSLIAGGEEGADSSHLTTRGSTSPTATVQAWRGLSIQIKSVILWKAPRTLFPKIFYYQFVLIYEDQCKSVSASARRI